MRRARWRCSTIGLLGVDEADREADVHDHVVADPGLGHERQRHRLAHAAEVDDALVAFELFHQPRGQG
jgi:hypothetical protein